MSGPALKWAMQADEEQPERPAMSAEKRLLLIALAYESDKYDNTITTDIGTIAKRCGIGRQSALRYVSEFMEDGPIRDTGKRTGYHNRVAVLQFVTEWLPDCASRTRTKKPLNSKSKRTIQTRPNSTSVDTIQGGHKATRMVRVDALNGTSSRHRMVRVDALNGTSIDTIQAPPLYNGLQELPITTQEKHNAQAPRGWLAAAPKNRDSFAPKNADAQRSIKSAASPKGDEVDPVEIARRTTRIKIALRSHGVIKGNAPLPMMLRKFTSVPRFDDSALHKALDRFEREGDRHHRVRSLVKIIEAVLSESPHHANEGDER